MQQRQILKLDDSVISQIVRLIQIGFLSQTDVADHMRNIRMEPSALNPESLVLTPEYVAKDKQDIDRMFDELESLMMDDAKGNLDA